MSTRIEVRKIKNLLVDLLPFYLTMLFHGNSRKHNHSIKHQSRTQSTYRTYKITAKAKVTDDGIGNSYVKTLGFSVIILKLFTKLST